MHAFWKTSLCLILAVATTDTRAASTVPACLDVSASAVHAGLHDFDFLIGDWSVHNRRLQQRLANSHDWVEFDAKDSFAELPGGLGTEEHYSTDFWKGYVALGLHLYDPQHQLWTLYWADNHNAPGTMQTLAKGAFVDGVGVFCAPDTFNGKPVTTRILWKRVDRNHVRWEQAFSIDRGVSWETNWTMDFTRR